MSTASTPPPQALAIPLYRRVLGASFDRLPPLVRALHDLDGSAVWSGRADVERGTHPICRLIAVIARLPQPGPDQPLTVTFTAAGDAERWHRAFGDRVFPSLQRAGHGGILERIGPAVITLVPQADATGLGLTVSRLTVFGMPMPRALVPIVATREHEADGRYRFEVEARLPHFGRLVRYAGWLAPIDTPPT